MKKIIRRLEIMIVITLAMTILLGSSVYANELGVLEDPNWEIVKKDVSEWYPSLSEAEQDELAAKIYQEKYVTSGVASVNADEETNEDFVDIAYLKNVEEETYIAGLISEHSGIETTTDAWRYNLNYLKLHYDDIMALEGVNTIFVDLYMEAYESELYMEAAKYIAELISEHSGIETTIGTWRYNLNYLKLHYDEIMAIEGVNSIFVDLYMEAHETEFYMEAYHL